MAGMVEEFDMSVIDQLRSRTEEVDINQFLKSTFGGYSKKSVLEYLAYQRKQQQSTADTFYKNMQTLYDEKEQLKISNEKLRNRIQKVEADYENLQEIIHTNRIDEGNMTLADVLNLKDKLALLENEKKQAYQINKSLELKTEQLEDTIYDLRNKLDQAEQEILAQREILIAEKNETKHQRERVAELTGLLEAEQDENRFLKEKYAEGEFNKLRLKVEELTDQLEYQNEIMAKQNEKLIAGDESIVLLRSVIEELKKNGQKMAKSMEDCQKENERLLSVNFQLNNLLEAEYSKQLALIREKSDINVERLQVEQKLNEALERIAHLEMKLCKKNKQDELAQVLISSLESSDP